MYPETDQFDERLLDVGDGHQVFWQQCGSPAGKPALVLHGGPGSGCAPWWRWLFDPRAYRVVLFDQRGRGRSRPYEDPRFRLCFARLVTHFWRHAVWLEEGELLRGVERLAGIPAVLVHGRLDVSSPLDVAWELSQAWEGSELHLVDDEGHGLDEVTARLVVAATDGFARRFPEDAG